MEYVTIVISLALLQYMGFGAMVGKARGTYGIKAPATTGNEMFERHFRVHMNSLESLIIFVPAIVAFATYVHAETAAGLGVIYLVGRFIYARAYVKEPGTRTLGTLLSGLPSIILLLGGAIGAWLALF
ncbi:MAPEG family protein [Proteobacteria bacterium 005FR1]|nr:MAPEG family protein [Proteobacteria bacterium 005FR1]